MQEFMEIYKNNVDEIEKFLTETIHNLGDLSTSTNQTKLFKVFPSLELIYICEKSSLKQISDNIFRNKTSSNAIGRDRNYLLEKAVCYDELICVTKPYVSTATGETCITIIKKEANSVYFLDFNLAILLERLGLIEVQKEFDLLTKGFYFITAAVMIILALFTIGYSLYEFIGSVFLKPDVSIESIFKPVIALTLGLAIFDLAKTIMEQEVIFKNYSKNSKLEYKVLTKFSITIIIALLIESLMVVFKIAIDDYSQMLNAVYLICGVGVLIISLGLFIYLSKKKG